MNVQKTLFSRVILPIFPYNPGNLAFPAEIFWRILTRREDLKHCETRKLERKSNIIELQYRCVTLLTTIGFIKARMILCIGTQNPMCLAG